MANFDAEDERTEELTTLQSIYPELILHDDDAFTATLELSVAPVKPLTVTFEPGQEVEHLAYLPPIRLELALPVEYPAYVPPTVKVSTSPSWLPHGLQQQLAAEANLLWAEYGGGMVLFTYINSIQEQADSAFGLTELKLPSSMWQELVQNSQRIQKDLFNKETFDCEVCLEPKKGLACYRMQRCGHVFCIACLQDYYNCCITEGEVNNVKCMSPECGSDKKKDRLLSPKELLQMPIARDQVERYANLRRKKKMESDPAIVFCPRTWCQGAMRTTKYPKITDVALMDDSDSEEEEEAGAQDPVSQVEPQTGYEKRKVGVEGMERLQVCEDCNLAFCVVCLASWHGDFERCERREAKQLTQEDQASLNFILRNTTPCPECSVPCEKSHGCNHITCRECRAHFCYLCSAWLSEDNPYTHFNDPHNKYCYQRLWEGAEGDVQQNNVEPAE
ncbi:ring finger [Pyrenophora seminiperda CCB06]|uniref:RBR-type E3 ubiquitin transferase n=1 Tax=Pyrenophora seminiperda CCB06 TaxID=1302712 RepID=A0A3M7LYD8_9PLEO|nr:ring finger [Pyrenophora seminiperda CCB06]